MKELAQWIQSRLASVNTHGIDLKKFKLRMRPHGDGTCTVEILNIATNRAAKARFPVQQERCLKAAVDMIKALEDEQIAGVPGGKPKERIRNLGTDSFGDMPIPNSQPE